MLISVIVPAYNDGNYIRDCLFSIINQTYRDFEIIVIDDGSSDNTGKICDEIADKDNRIKVIHKENTGVSDSRNVGIKEAIGEYICFVDSDDVLDLDYFEQVSSILKSNKYSIIFNCRKLIYTSGAIKEDYRLNHSVEISKDKALSELFFAKLICWGVVSTFFKLEHIKDLKFNKLIAFAEDFLFKYKAIKKCTGDLLYMPLCKYNYLIRKDSSGDSYSLKKRSQDLEVIKKVISNEPKKNGDILYYKQYLPRLSAYAIQGWLSKDIEDQKVAEKAKKELTNHIFQLLISNKVSLKTKVKITISALPISLIKVLGSVVYRKN